ncbi:conserved hypothetical protein [Renibacterium salmoninarum ATCC 33209]|uniref:Muconolactone isomerase domain-containing protein n=1 Tax=Renibacterium salmoninarum (strain ATCC 33209 / DSM 20767 / JCM 11484 / NBRC 15589 / NCIMB 2235) TaxID=288705 RepID=A9WKP9_RENSM|nr:hypothetical protein [Renibacterium salmoninarum]ABY21858.1 conserved hypothetical protein [Renibacterium salmoninarum ATCC 33209]
MEFLVLSERDLVNFSLADFEPYIPGETNTIRRLYGEGKVRNIWLRGDTRGVCFILEAQDAAEAQAIIDALPLAQAKMSSFQLIPLNPYGGFAQQQ